mmetsp:Transcript_114839/g.335885  ORF Transcript_114839/g.335885 Transcript_114839/m.335885 type:complete len:450 (+) Transcript_114839:138-1487(+)
MRCSWMAAVVYLNVLLYSLCFRLQAPVEPFLVQSLARPGTDAGMAYSSLQSWASLVYTSGSLAMGLLLDIWGMRCSFIICFLSTALSYGLLSVATTMPLLFISRVPTFFQHGFLLSQALLLQETSEEGRGGALGRLQLAYTAGASVSPVVGGFLASSGDLYIGARAATALSLLSAGLCLLLPKSTAVDHGGDYELSSAEPAVLGSPSLYREEPAKRSSSPMAGSFGGLPMPTVTPFTLRLLGIPKLRALLSRRVLLILILAKIGLAVCSSLDGTTEPLVLIYKFGLSPEQLGEVQGGSVFLGGIIGACALGPLSKRLTPGVLLQRCLMIRAILGLVATIAISETIGLPNEKVGHLYLLYVFLMNINGSIMGNSLTVYTTAAVVREERGTLMGLEHAIHSLPQMVSPMIAGVLLHVGGGALATGTSALLTVGMMLALRRQVLPRYRSKDA